MIVGTSSNSGKTTVVAGLCRLFANRGLAVAPLKSQNMALNAYVTADGGEIAQATAMQARGARQEPIVHMNPLLLKPKSDDVAQLIVHGKARMDVSARDYFLEDGLQGLKIGAIEESIAHLKSRFDLIVAEGAGSCAEPNLRRLDVVNMGLARMLEARVFVVVDIDKGGAFADILGTLEVMRLTEPKDLELIEGFILNKFRGDRTVLQPAIDFSFAHTKIPIVGVLPYLHDLRLEEEDRVRERPCNDPEVDIAVILLPHISNATDFEFLDEEPGVQVRYVKSAESLGLPDAIILPGTKNTTWDLDYIRRTGLEQAIVALAGRTPLIGVCGGFQMLGRTLCDPHRFESSLGTIPGMGLLAIDVEFSSTKTVTRRDYAPSADNPFRDAGDVRGYEIHAGHVHYGSSRPAYAYAGGRDGAVDPERRIFGTFIHDLFRNPAVARSFVNALRRSKGLPELTTQLPQVHDRIDASYQRLASLLEEHCGF
ncbi:cobyric acid synthase [Pendulispora albinea]|uniref:Cobyric acid synthase n=1 Tax=Pendulispora albinea TaxID=2741071 RepID=A0ABZ2LXV1_9BACT